MSESSESSGESAENAFCIFLHVVEGIGLQRSRTESFERHQDQILMHTSLNNVKFEIEGHSTETVTVFNSNCIWECDLDDIKRMKTDNRPVRIECFQVSSNKKEPPLKLIGTLLLPIRGLPIIASLRNYQPKLFWHKLGALNMEWRSYKPEIYLLLVVAKKALIDNNSFDALLGKKKVLPFFSPNPPETTDMLQSQSNVYVQLLNQVGLIQVGNNPNLDCDIFQVTLTLKCVRDLKKLFEVEANAAQGNFIFQYEILGSASHDEVAIEASDFYTLNEKVALRFKTSARSLQLYFQRIFYIPINIYFNGYAVANYRFDCSKFFPEESYFNSNPIWTKNGSFFFDRLHKILSPRTKKPSVDFVFQVQLLESNSKKNPKDIPNFEGFKVDKGAIGDCKQNNDGLQQRRFAAQTARIHETEGQETPGRQPYLRANSEPFLATTSSTERIPPLNAKNVETIENKTRADVGVETEIQFCDRKTIGVNTEPPPTSSTDARNPDDMTLQVVKELEAWRGQQMDAFLKKLEEKEKAKDKAAKIEEDSKKDDLDALQQRLLYKMLECDQIREQLDLQRSQKRIQNVEDKTELLNHEKSKLEEENQTLKKNIAQLEQKLITFGRTHIPAGQLKEMITDLREQAAHFIAVEKERNFYKEQLSRVNLELHQLKLKSLMQQEADLLKEHPFDDDADILDISLDNVCLESGSQERTGKEVSSSKPFSIKDVILLDSDSSSVCDFESEEI